MPSRGRLKCQQCSKLSLEQALEKHGAVGDGCWSGEPCHKRRTYYKNRERYNRSRRIKYNADVQRCRHKLDSLKTPALLRARDSCVDEGCPIYAETPLDKEEATQLQGVSIPSIPAVVIYFYRQRKNDQLHAIRADLWVGQLKLASYPTVHTLGWTERQVKDYIRSAVSAFSQEYEVQISGIAATVEREPSICPLKNCPLKPQDDLDIVVSK